MLGINTNFSWGLKKLDDKLVPFTVIKNVCLVPRHEDKMLKTAGYLDAFLNIIPGCNIKCPSMYCVSVRGIPSSWVWITPAAWRCGFCAANCQLTRQSCHPFRFWIRHKAHSHELNVVYFSVRHMLLRDYIHVGLQARRFALECFVQPSSWIRLGPRQDLRPIDQQSGTQTRH
jgi:hypothetical protein